MTKSNVNAGPDMSQESTGRPPTRRKAIRRLDLGILLALIIAEGCGSGDTPDRRAISGDVTLDGRPLDEGAILLEPPSASHRGMAVGATIRRGSFAIARESGPTPGTYRVRIYSSSGVQAPPGKGQSQGTRRPMQERLPPAYNVASELKADVSVGGPNHFRYDLRGNEGS